MALSDILKKIIRNTSELDTKNVGFIILHLISLVTLLACLVDDRWLLGDEGKQGLWNYCYKNGTAQCCGEIGKVLGYKGNCIFLGKKNGTIINYIGSDTSYPFIEDKTTIKTD